jgi:hypothetical protein
VIYRDFDNCEIEVVNSEETFFKLREELKLKSFSSKLEYIAINELSLPQKPAKSLVEKFSKHIIFLIISDENFTI